MNISRRSSHCQGFSLVELMVAITIGLIVVAGILTLFQSTLQNNRDLATGKQLEGELHATLDLIARDLRRAGAMGNPLRQLEGVANPFIIDAPSAYTGEAANSCLTFGYDFNGNGSINSATPDERYGYRKRGGVVQMRVGGQACTANVTLAPWNNVTTAALVEVTSLQFTITSTASLGVTERVAVVGIAGRLVRDNTVARSLSRTVRLRNDGYP